MNITQLSLKRPVTTMMVFISFIVIGLIATRQLPLEFLPDISFPGAYVSIPYPNSTPEETERLITRPVEEALATISGLERMNSNSRENEAGVFVGFKMGSDIRLKSMEIREKIDGIRDQLPDDVEQINVFKFSAQDDPIMNLRISSDRDLSNAYDLLYRNLVQRIERLPGVGKVELNGVDKREIRVELNSDRLAAYDINLNELAQTLRTANFSVSAGKISDSGKRYLVRPIGEITSPEELSQILIGDNLRLEDVATVAYEMPERDYGRHLDRKYAVSLEVFKESGANTVEVADRVLAEIEVVNQSPEMSGIAIYEMFNQATGIISSLRELLNSGLIGALFSLIVLYFFLRQFGTTIIVALAVPFSLVVTLAVLYFLGLTLNILSMTGLILAIGMLVDNAVVVTENIHRHQLLTGDRVKGTIFGVKEVAMAVTAGTLTSIIVFLPNIVSEDSMIAIQLYHVAISIIIALVASLLISLTVIPLLTSRMNPPEPNEKETIIDRSVVKYTGMLRWLINHRYTSVGLILLTVFSVAIPAGFMTIDMFPRQEDRELMLQFNIEGTYTLERVEETVDRIEEYLYANQEEFDIESVYSYYRTDMAQSTLILTEGDEVTKSVEQIKKAIEDSLPKIALGKPSFEYRNMGSGDQMRVYLIGESNEELVKLSKNAIWQLEQIPGISDVRSENETGNEEVRLVVDRELARRYGVSSEEVASVVSNAMRGTRLRKLRDSQGEVDVILAFDDAARQTIEDLRNIPVINSEQGGMLKLASLASFEQRTGPSSIRRENRQTSLGITANLDGIAMDEARTEIARVLNRINYPTGYGWNYGRSFDQDTEAQNEMLINMLLALALIYLVMSALFESVLYPSSIITAILFAVIGVFWFFFITGTTFSFTAMIGILILMGVVVNNGIVLVDHINQLREKGMDRNEAIIQAGRDRLRPILMTAGTTVLGLVPLCLATTQIGGDGPPYFPMARAIVGGLAFSTVVTMVILPTIYVMLDDLKNWSVRVLRHARR